MELADEDVFDVGPESRRETLALFEQIEKQRKENFKRDGMVAFFDVLGYKEIATSIRFLCRQKQRAVMA